MFSGFTKLSVAHIVEAVGNEPETLDRDHLRDSMNIAVARYVVAMEGGPRRARKRSAVRQNAKLEIAQLCRKLLDFLERRELQFTVAQIAAIYESKELLDIDAHEAPSFSALLSALRALQLAAEKPIKAGNGTGALQRLIGRDLCDVYKRHFRRRAGRSMSPEGGRPYGPFIRFVLAVSNELQQAGLPVDVSIHTIPTYMKRERRKGTKRPPSRA